MNVRYTDALCLFQICMGEVLSFRAAKNYVTLNMFSLRMLVKSCQLILKKAEKYPIICQENPGKVGTFFFLQNVLITLLQCSE